MADFAGSGVADTERAGDGSGTLVAMMGAFFGAIQSGDYLGILAYLPPFPEVERELGNLRLMLRNHLRVATTLERFGPAFPAFDRAGL